MSWWRRMGKRVVDEIIWGIYLAAMFICAYVGVYAYFVGRTTYMWLGLIGWAGSWGWGLFFKYYVVNPGRGKGRRNAVGGRRIVRSRIWDRRAVR